MSVECIVFEDEPGEGKTAQRLIYYFQMFSPSLQRAIVRLLEIALILGRKIG